MHDESPLAISDVGGLTALALGVCLLPVAPIAGLPFLGLSASLFAVPRINQGLTRDSPATTATQDAPPQSDAELVRRAGAAFRRSDSSEADDIGPEQARADLRLCIQQLERMSYGPLPPVSRCAEADHLIRFRPWRERVSSTLRADSAALGSLCNEFREMIEDPPEGCNPMSEGQYLETQNTLMFLHNLGTIYIRATGALLDARQS